MFETTIRYLGGLLSAYELSNREHPVLLAKAKEVADTLSLAWVGVSQAAMRARLGTDKSEPQGNQIPYGQLTQDNVPIKATVRLGDLGIRFVSTYPSETVEYCGSWYSECADRATAVRVTERHTALAGVVHTKVGF